MIEIIMRIINWSVLITFVLCYGYQTVYFFNRFFLKDNENGNNNEDSNNYAVVIAARNEEKVITNLIRSIQRQSYTSGKIDIYVIADNCTDDTAKKAESCGAITYKRENLNEIGKGYALRELFDHLIGEQRIQRYDGFFIFDADNILDEKYVEKMNELFCRGYQVVTGLRNSVNFRSNWISFSYGIWFLHESQFLNKGRHHAKNNCMVLGTGYLIRRELIEQNNGWNHVLLTEDIEFNAKCILQDISVGYCEQAVFYDVQPITLRESWKQRLRWIKGYYQVVSKYGKALANKCIKEKSASCFDMLMADIPAFVLTAVYALLMISLAIVGIATGQDISFVIYAAVKFVMVSYVVLYLLGIQTTFEQREHIRMPLERAIRFTFLFPLFMYTYFPVAIEALFVNVTWTPVSHANID